MNGINQTVWSTNTSTKTTASMNTTIVQIQDTGNLILRDLATGNPIWESFSHPSNVFLPTMKISDNIITHEKVALSSWKSDSDPGVGNFSFGIDVRNDIVQMFIWNNGRPHWRSGPWDGDTFSGQYSWSTSPYMEGLSIGMNDRTGTVFLTTPERRVLNIHALNSSGNLMRMVWDDQRKNWNTFWMQPHTECSVYGLCGPFVTVGSCNNDFYICSCLRGFEPTNRDEWGRENWSSGCQRRIQLQCNYTSGSDGDGFFRMESMNIPDSAIKFSNANEDVCRQRCLVNCSCIAYAYPPKIGCMFWTDSLIDIRRYSSSPGYGIDLYIRLSPSEFDNHKGKKLFIIIPVAFISTCIFIFIAWWCTMVVKRKGIMRRKDTKKGFETFSSDSTSVVLEDELEKVKLAEEFPLFTFETLANATDQFHGNNLLGKGGFGYVYKGILENGKEIAVKRLSAASGQGMDEFMNEVIVISKLQHRNLVKLIGCCVERKEKLLVYEHMPNKSLDLCLFDPSQTNLDWTKRFSIIQGIARGLLYLHRDSRLTIIHRDLKPSNVLLDLDWNPKISDFGLAKIFGGNQDHGNTARVVGTYGYMAPEYAVEGRFSEKSDVYSFGVMMLEIINGEKNARYYNYDKSLSLLGYAWKLWSEENGLAFADERIAMSPDLPAQIVRCIHIALLCVQQFPKDRPSTQTLLSMLSHEIVDLPIPEQPVFAVGPTQPICQVGKNSTNNVTLTSIDGR
ncbi:hypothetical protein ACP275_08G108600 [Erythranthe tilingii]